MADDKGRIVEELQKTVAEIACIEAIGNAARKSINDEKQRQIAEIEATAKAIGADSCEEDNERNKMLSDIEKAIDSGNIDDILSSIQRFTK